MDHEDNMLSILAAKGSQIQHIKGVKKVRSAIKLCY